MKRAITRLGLAGLLALTTAFAVVGCDDGSPLAPPNDATGLAAPIPTVGGNPVSIGNGRIAYQPYPGNPGKYYKQLWTGVFQDITSGDPATVDAGFTKLENEAAGTANQWFMTWANQSSGKLDDHFPLLKARDEGPVDAEGGDGDEVTICTSVEIIIEGTVKKGSKVTYDAGLFSGEHTWDQDESVDFTIPLSYETTAPAGSSVSNNSTTTLEYDGPIEWTAPGGEPSIDADVDITITINVIVTTKEGNR